MKQIIASVFFYYLVLLGTTFLAFLNLIIITARVYKLRLADANYDRYSLGTSGYL